MLIDSYDTARQVLQYAIVHKDPVAISLSGMASKMLFGVSYEELLLKMESENLIRFRDGVRSALNVEVIN